MNSNATDTLAINAIILLSLQLLYFLPIGIAAFRKHNNFWPLVVINLLLGASIPISAFLRYLPVEIPTFLFLFPTIVWAYLIWVITLAWSISNPLNLQNKPSN